MELNFVTIFLSPREGIAMQAAVAFLKRKKKNRQAGNIGKNGAFFLQDD